jgi:cyclomaltodextrinase / maltogenic alpha-amylase / neopullulanase
MPIETPGWVRDAVFYQVFPDRYAMSERVPKPGPLEPWDDAPTIHGFKGGDLYGVLEHLDHIAELGANALYLNPVFQSASNHRYHTYDYYTVDPLLGGNKALRDLIDACHERGMHVILDGVFNHASRGFWPFHHVLEAGRASPYRDWFFFHHDDLEAGRPIRAYPIEAPSPDITTDPLGQGGGSIQTLGYQAWWDLPALPKLNTGDPHVREYLLSVAEHWIRFGADGWRLDVAEEVPDDFWREFRGRVRGANAEAYIVAEIWHERPDALTGDRFDALMDYPLMGAILSFTGAGRLDRRVVGQHHTVAALVSEDDAPAFATRLDRALHVYDPAVTAVQLHLLGSHDTPRFLSMVSGDTSALRLATLLQMTLPGAPSIYYGDEIGLRGELDPANRAAFPWQHPDRWDRELLADITTAVHLRREHAVLRHGSTRIVAAEGRTIALLRQLDDRSVLVVVNTADEGATVELHIGELEGRTLDPVRWSRAEPVAPQLRVQDGRARVTIAARDGTVYLAG